LDEIYHPIWAAFPNNPTLRIADTCRRVAEVVYGALTLYVGSLSEALYPDGTPVTDRS